MLDRRPGLVQLRLEALDVDQERAAVLQGKTGPGAGAVYRLRLPERNIRAVQGRRLGPINRVS